MSPGRATRIAKGPWQPLIDEVLNTIGGVLFTPRRRSGVLFLAALGSSPRHIVFALLGLFTAMWAGRLLSPQAAIHRLGLHHGAGLLAGAALATYLPDGFFPWFLVPAAALLAALLVSALTPLLSRNGLPVLALPFVLATFVTLSTATLLFQGSLPLAEMQPLLPGLEQMEVWLGSRLPLLAQEYLRSFGSLLFLPSLTGGLLVVAGLLAGSRITVLAMLAGGLLGTGLLQVLSGGIFQKSAFGLVAFNAILTAAALSGLFLAINARSLVYAALAVGSSMLVAMALHPVLSVLGLPVLALPFTLTVWLFLLPLRMGTLDSERLGIWAPPLELVGRAEDNLRAFERWKRLRELPGPVLSLPLRGVWTVTQGPGGDLTHNTLLGAQAWDFMLLEEDGRGADWPADQVEHFHGWACPVLAPADGTVVALESSQPDNPVHAANTFSPWGNWLLIAHVEGSCTLLAHLRSGSIGVAAGQRVSRGQELAQVGNSGRSPEPHLHLQLNEGPWLASRSLPARFGSWVEFPPGETAIFHPLGQPDRGMRVGSLEGMDGQECSACYPFAVPGRQWRYTVTRGRRQEEVLLRLRAGLWGRLILDDGVSTAQVVWWPGWVQLLPLAEGDPDRLSLPGRHGLVDLMLLMLPALSCRVDGTLRTRCQVRSHGLAQGWRRLLTLEQDGDVELSARVEEGPTLSLLGGAQLGAQGKRRMKAEYRAEAHRGITRLVLTQEGGRVLADFRLQQNGGEDA